MQAPEISPAAVERGVGELRPLVPRFRTLKRSDIAWQGVRGGEEVLIKKADEAIKRLGRFSRQRFIFRVSDSTSSGPRGWFRTLNSFFLLRVDLELDGLAHRRIACSWFLSC